jgi:hypothetical protein
MSELAAADKSMGPSCVGEGCGVTQRLHVPNGPQAQQTHYADTQQHHSTPFSARCSTVKLEALIQPPLLQPAGTLSCMVLTKLQMTWFHLTGDAGGLTCVFGPTNTNTRNRCNTQSPRLGTCISLYNGGCSLTYHRCWLPGRTASTRVMHVQ